MASHSRFGAWSGNPRQLGLFRAVFGALVLLRGVYLVEQARTAAAENVFSSHGLADVAAAGAVVVAWFALGTALLVGWRSRTASALLAALIFGLLWADPLFYNNHLYLMGLVALLLACAGPGASLSMDARHGHGPGTAAAWPAQLLKLQVSIVYTFAALSKVQEDFVSGLSLHVHLSQGPFASLLPQALLDSFALLVSVSVAAIAVQLFLAVGLWLEPVRAWAFLAGFVLHAPMVLLANSAHQALRLVIFSVLMWALYLLFLNVPARGRIVSWDRHAPAVDRMVRAAARLDWLQALTFDPNDGPVSPPRGCAPAGGPSGVALAVVEPNGRAWVGGGALRRIAGVLPAGFLWAAIVPTALLRRAGSRRPTRTPEPASRVQTGSRDPAGR